VSRHRSPGGRGAHPGPQADVRRLSQGRGAAASPARRHVLPSPGAAPGPAGRSGSVLDRPGLRRAIGGAALTGGVLTVVVPGADLLVAAPATIVTDAAAVGLASEDVASVEEPAGQRASVLPVAFLRDAGDRADADGLLKAVGLADVARRAEEERAARVNCDADLSAVTGVRTWVRDAARFLSCLYDEPDLIGIAGRGRVSDHPRGLAIDLMTTGAEGDRIAACALRNQEALGISYVIWKQRVNYGDGWERMEDRGDATENHFDHVHISFEPGAGSGVPDPELCT
jgi:hypothetical protein